MARKAESVAPLAAGLGEDRALALGADVGDRAAISGAVAETAGKFGRPDAAYANAGIGVGTAFFGTDDPDPTAWAEMVRITVLGAAYTARAVLPELTKSTGHLLITDILSSARSRTWSRTTSPGPCSTR